MKRQPIPDGGGKMPIGARVAPDIRSAFRWRLRQEGLNTNKAVAALVELFIEDKTLRRAVRAKAVEGAGNSAATAKEAL